MTTLDSIIQNSKEPAVTKAVFDELKKYGDDNKKNYAEVTKRIDNIEVMLQRPGASSPADFKGIKADEVKQFEKMLFDLRKQDIKADNNLISEYTKGFEWYCKNGGNPAVVVNPEFAKSLSVGVDPDGGYLVTPLMANTITQKLFDSDPVRQLARTEIISGSDAWEEISDADDIDGGWITETGARTETDTSKLGKQRIVAHELYAMPISTTKLIEDGKNIEAWLSRKAADKFYRLEGAAFVSGDGVGKPRGFLTYPDGTSWGMVEQISLGSATPGADTLINMIDSLQEEYRGNATFLMNSTTLNYFRKLKDGQGQYLFMADPTRQFSGFLFGYPVRTSTTMPTLAASALSVALADWRRAYCIVDRIGISLIRDPYTNKGHVLFYFKKRVGGDILNYDAIKIGVCA